jgi:hypothetical protein
VSEEEKLKYYIWGMSDALGVEPEDVDKKEALIQMKWCEDNL